LPQLSFEFQNGFKLSFIFGAWRPLSGFMVADSLDAMIAAL